MKRPKGDPEPPSPYDGARGDTGHSGPIDERDRKFAGDTGYAHQGDTGVDHKDVHRSHLFVGKSTTIGHKRTSWGAMTIWAGPLYFMRLTKGFALWIWHLMISIEWDT